jgi:hypothetical protein
MKHLQTFENFIVEAKGPLKTSDIENIEYAQPEYNGKIKPVLYKLYVRMKRAKEVLSYYTIEDFNKEFGTKINSSLSYDPNGFVKEVSKLLPGVKVELGEYDIS